MDKISLLKNQRLRSINRAHCWIKCGLAQLQTSLPLTDPDSSPENGLCCVTKLRHVWSLLFCFFFFFSVSSSMHAKKKRKGFTFTCLCCPLQKRGKIVWGFRNDGWSWEMETMERICPCCCCCTSSMKKALLVENREIIKDDGKWRCLLAEGDDDAGNGEACRWFSFISLLLLFSLPLFFFFLRLGSRMGVGRDGATLKQHSLIWLWTGPPWIRKHGQDNWKVSLKQGHCKASQERGNLWGNTKGRIQNIRRNTKRSRRSGHCIAYPKTCNR